MNSLTACEKARSRTGSQEADAFLEWEWEQKFWAAVFKGGGADQELKDCLFTMVVNRSKNLQPHPQTVPQPMSKLYPLHSIIGK